MLAAVLWITGTTTALFALLLFTETLDRHSSISFVRRVAERPGSPEMAERLIAEECERLLRTPG